MRIFGLKMWLAILVACLVLPMGAMTSAANAEEGAAKKAKAAKPERKKAKAKGAGKERPNLEERVKQRFEKLDADQSGTVSLDEFKSAPGQKKGKGKELDAEQAQAKTAKMEQRFKTLDADGNGELTLEEMQNPPKRANKEAGVKRAKKDRPNKKAAP